MFAAIMDWPLQKGNVNLALLQTGASKCHLYVITSRYCTERRFLWGLRLASLELVTSN